MKQLYADLANSLANLDWYQETSGEGPWKSPSEQSMQTAALIDIMKSLRSLVSLLRCDNFTKMPRSLKSIENLAREFLVAPRRKRKKVTP